MGGVLSCQGCNITLVGTRMLNNIAQRGGAINLQTESNLTVSQGTF